MSAPRISIVLVTCNGADTLPAVLEAIARQRVDCSVETVAVDSGSTDGSTALLAKFVDRLITIAPDTFDHGLTRNLGIEQARGDLIVLLVQDAVPASSSWLAELIAPLVADESVAGTFARQRPRPDASAVTRHYHERQMAAGGEDRTLTLSSLEELEALDPADRLHRCTFDNVCACIRRSVWRQVPFRATPIAEDVEWARSVLLAGFRLEYVSGSEVVHSHDRAARYEFARTYALHRRLFELFELRTIPTLPQLAAATLSSLRLHWHCQRVIPGPARRAADTRRAMALAVAWPLGQYLGALSAVRGWRPLRFTRV